MSKLTIGENMTDNKELKDRLGYLLDKLEFMVGNDLASNNEIDADIQELKCLLTELEVLG